MKCRQTLEIEHTRKTLALVDTFMEVYFDDHGKEHFRELEGK